LTDPSGTVTRLKIIHAWINNINRGCQLIATERKKVKPELYFVMRSIHFLRRRFGLRLDG